MLNDLYQIIVHLNTLTHPLRELLQKNVDFDWSETFNETFEKFISKMKFSTMFHISSTIKK